MTTSADSRGVTMRVSRNLRDIIHDQQRKLSVAFARSVTVVETCDVLAHTLTLAIEATPSSAKEDTDQ